MIVVRALGPVEVSVNGAKAPAALGWRKHLALMVYLARSPKRARTREHLMGLLWGEKPEQAARQSLNEALRILRRSTGDGGLDSDAAQVRIAPSAVALDIDTFEVLAGRGDYAGAAALVHGEFLAGFSVRGASEFDTWLAAERDHWRRRSVDVMVQLAEQLLGAGNVAAANDIMERARDLDWRPETAVRTAMRGLALAGDRAGALMLFEAFAEKLRRELGAEPDAETRGLAERVRQGKKWLLPEGADALGAAAAESRRAPLIGRARELERLVDAWTVCRTKRKATVAVIEGDGGTGKTRLAEELVERARLDGAAIAAARAVEADRGEAWRGMSAMAQGGLLDAPGVAGAPPAALEQLRGTAPPVALGSAFSEVLQAIAEEQPVLLLVDDAHWLDRESILALGAAVRDRAKSPIGFFITMAPHVVCPELDGLRTRIGGDVAGAVVKLGGFERDSVIELARWAMPSYGPEQVDRLARRVLADSAGIPLLVVALLQAVAAGFEPKEKPGVWPKPHETFEETLPGELPDNVVAAIRVNFRRLSPHAQQVLVAAAVLGGRVSTARLGRASNLVGDALVGALDELEWQGWLTAESRGYAFVARIVGDVIDRDMVMPGQRQRIRGAAGGPA